MQEVSRRQFEDRLLRIFQARGWRDRDAAVERLVEHAVDAEDRTLTNADLAGVLPEVFLRRNGIDSQQVASAIADEMSGVVVAVDRRRFDLITIDEIDSFAVVRQVTAQEVAAFSAPLRVPERVIKHCIHTVLDDPYADIDWGGERADVITTHVRVAGRRLRSAFLLKGLSVPRPLYIKELGTRGDQIVRLVGLHAELSVVQHVHEIPAETVDALRHGLASLRETDVGEALGCIIDGVDTARLLRGCGYIDDSGALTEVGKAANTEMKQLGRKPDT